MTLNIQRTLMLPCWTSDGVQHTLRLVLTSAWSVGLYKELNYFIDRWTEGRTGCLLCNCVVLWRTDRKRAFSLLFEVEGSVGWDVSLHCICNMSVYLAQWVWRQSEELKRNKLKITDIGWGTLQTWKKENNSTTCVTLHMSEDSTRPFIMSQVLGFEHAHKHTGLLLIWQKDTKSQSIKKKQWLLEHWRNLLWHHNT